MSCVGGQCSGQVRCAYHGAVYAKEAMEKRGFVLLTEYFTHDGEPVDAEFFDMAKAVNMAGIDMQRWLAGWDHKNGTPIYGIWAPRIAAALLGTCGGRMPAEALAKVLIKGKVDAEFIQAVDAAWRMGGKAAVDDLLKDALPSLASQIGKKCSVCGEEYKHRRSCTYHPSNRNTR